MKLSIGVRAAQSTHDDWKERDIIENIPKDPRTMINSFDLKPAVLAFVCCPKCFAMYPLNEDEHAYPDTCTHRSTPNSDICGRTLRKTRTVKGRKFSFPSRRILLQDLKRWCGEILSRPGYEDYLDKPLDPTPPEVMHDMMDSPGLREFLGPDGTPFVFKSGHYVFSLNMDGFNPYKSKEAGKHVTVGGVYMACLNLPPSIRYDLENMFLVCLIPGPNEPSLDQINHILRPLVDVLLEFWDPGVRYDATPNFPNGRTVHIALVPLVCDLPAARQMSGFASHSCTNFCPYCYLKLDDIDNIETTTWKNRTASDFREAAGKWRDAQSEDARKFEFDQSGVRYSELLRLPYWGPHPIHGCGSYARSTSW